MGVQPVMARFGLLLLGVMTHMGLSLMMVLSVEIYYHCMHDGALNSKGCCGDSTLPTTCCFVAIIATLSYYQREKLKLYKAECDNSLHMLKEKSHNLAIKNKFIATLAHEIRNFVTK